LDDDIKGPCADEPVQALLRPKRCKRFVHETNRAAAGLMATFSPSGTSRSSRRDGEVQMKQISGFCRAPMLGLGLLLALCGAARCDDPAESSRESIIQGVRDDVRRHIRDIEARSGRAEASRVGAPRRVAKRRQ
jgi:hypothetical protein